MRNGQQNRQQFVIGNYNGNTDRIAGIRRRAGQRPGNLEGVVENSGTAAFTFSVRQSNDNNVASGDPYATKQIRVAGTNVNSVVVQPGGIVEFVIDGTIKKYVELVCTGYSGAAGVVTLETNFGEWTEVGQTATAYPD